MKKVKIPKRVGGVKIPKKVRRKAKKAVRMAGSPEMRELAAAALGAAAQARTARVRIEVEPIAEAIRAAALDGLRRFLEGLEEGLREAEVEPGRRR